MRLLCPIEPLDSRALSPTPRGSFRFLPVLVLGLSLPLLFAQSAYALQAVVSVYQTSWYTSQAAKSYGDFTTTRACVPFPVLFEGWKSSPRTSIVEYRWNFGDGSPEETGLNAVHLYEKPGNYTARLTVTDTTGATSSATLAIAALARTGKTYYVDSELGNDSNAGTSPGTGAWRTATYAFKGIAQARYGPGDQILFKRGQTFGIIGGQVAPGHGRAKYGYLFGAYGTGPKPKIQFVGGQTDYIIQQIGNGMAHVCFSDLEFSLTSPAGVVAADFFFCSQDLTNLLFLRVDMRDFSSAAVMSGGIGNREISGLFIIDSTFTNSTRAMVYATASRIGIVNSKFDLAGNHIAYLAYANVGVVKGNTMARPAFGRTALRVSGEGSLPTRPTNNVLIADNKFIGWIDPIADNQAHNGGGTRYNYQLINLSSNGPWMQYMQDCVFERNICTNAENILLVNDYDNLIIRNNLFVSRSEDLGSSIRFGFPSWDARPMRDIQFVGNTVVTAGLRSGGVDYALELSNYIGQPYNGMTQHQNIVIKNNIVQVYSGKGRALHLGSEVPSLAQALDMDNNVFYSPNTTDGIVQAGGTSRGGGTLYTLNTWRTTKGHDLLSKQMDPMLADLVGPDGTFSGTTFDEDMRPRTASPALDAGLKLAAIPYDILGTKRPLGNAPDCGAYELSSLLQVSTQGQGTVTVNPPSGHVLGQTVTLTATPQPNWTFAGWSGALTGSTNPTQLTLNGDKAVTARFVQSKFAVGVNVVGGGSVTLSPQTSPYTKNTVVTLRALPSQGRTFLGWSGALSGTSTTTQWTATADSTITATFSQATCDLHVQVVGEGSIGYNTRPPYPQNGSATLTAYPASGWRFWGWSGDFTGSLATATIPMTSDKTVTAMFVQNPNNVPLENLVINVVGPGTVLEDPPPPHPKGTSVSLDAVPNPGCYFVGWVGALDGPDNTKDLKLDSTRVVTAFFSDVPDSELGSLGIPLFRETE